MKKWNLGELAEFSKSQPVKKDILKTKTFNTALVCLEAGQEIPPHPETYDVCFYVISGWATFTVGDKKAELGAGSMIFSPANVARGIKSIERLSVLGFRSGNPR